MVDQATGAVALVVGVGLAITAFVYAGVTILRGMIGRSRRRRIVLPLAGIGLGWLFVALVLTYLEAEPNMKNAALTLLAGFWGYVSSAGLHSQGKDARGEKG